MNDVKNALIVSEYYPALLPPEQNQAQPVGRLTPHFHNITIENLTGTGIGATGAIVGLPESPITDRALKNVRIEARKGMTVGYAEDSGEGISIKAAEGDPIVKLRGAKMTLRRDRESPEGTGEEDSGDSGCGKRLASDWLAGL
jgi:hypothetical protein